MGKRTKYQIDEHAQLLLVVHSNLVDNESNEDAATLENVILTESKSNNPSETKREWEHGKYELGRRVVAESSTGEEVSIRNIRLDDTDGGEAENILLEEGVHFSHVHNQVTEDSLSSTLLHPIDQAVILSLCLDVSNSNPAVSFEDKFFMKNIGWLNHRRDASIHYVDLKSISQTPKVD